VAQHLSRTSISVGAEPQFRRTPGTAQRVLRRAWTRVVGGPVPGTSRPGHRRPSPAHVGTGMTAGGNTGAGLPGLNSWNPKRPEEPDVRPTSPVLCELGEGNLPRLRDPELIG